MGSVYLTQLADWCREAGLRVVEQGGWQHRARGSGGYEAGRPWAIMWHHTASKTSPANDADYMCFGSPDAPIANLLLARDGEVWVLAGGATNTNGKGKATVFSKGTVPADSMNSYAIGIEAANNGVGEPWPQAQIDAYFVLNNLLASHLGLSPDDCCTHQAYAPDRKIDPATAGGVQGPWHPGSVTSSGTWSLPDIEREAISRAGTLPPPLPPPIPTPVEGDEVLVVALDSNGTAWVGNGITRYALNDPAIFDRYVLVWSGRFLNTSGKQVKGWPDVATVDDMVIASLGRE